MEGTEQRKIALEVKDWAERAKDEKQFSRGDYTTALNYILMFVGSKRSR